MLFSYFHWTHLLHLHLFCVFFWLITSSLVFLMDINCQILFTFYLFIIFIIFLFEWGEGKQVLWMSINLLSKQIRKAWFWGPQWVCVCRRRIKACWRRSCWGGQCPRGSFLLPGPRKRGRGRVWEKAKWLFMGLWRPKLQLRDQTGCTGQQGEPWAGWSCGLSKGDQPGRRRVPDWNVQPGFSSQHGVGRPDVHRRQKIVG